MRLRPVYKEQEVMLTARLRNQELGFWFMVLILENKGRLLITDEAYSVLIVPVESYN